MQFGTRLLVTAVSQRLGDGPIGAQDVVTQISANAKHRHIRYDLFIEIVDGDLGLKPGDHIEIAGNCPADG